VVTSERKNKVNLLSLEIKKKNNYKLIIKEIIIIKEPFDGL